MHHLGVLWLRACARVRAFNCQQILTWESASAEKLLDASREYDRVCKNLYDQRASSVGALPHTAQHKFAHCGQSASSGSALDREPWRWRRGRGRGRGGYIVQGNPRVLVQRFSARQQGLACPVRELRASIKLASHRGPGGQMVDWMGPEDEEILTYLKDARVATFTVCPCPRSRRSERCPHDGIRRVRKSERCAVLWAGRKGRGTRSASRSGRTRSSPTPCWSAATPSPRRLSRANRSASASQRRRASSGRSHLRVRPRPSRGGARTARALGRQGSCR